MQPNVKFLKFTSNKKKIEEKLIKRKYKRSLKGLLSSFCVGLFSVTESDC